jgi:hypothetical protein
MLTRYAASLTAILLSLTLLLPSLGAAAQEEPAPAPTPTPDRAPSYERGVPAGALRLPGEPPAVGDLIAEDSLTFPGAIPGSFNCPSGRSIGEFVGEGYILKVTGPCSESVRGAWVALPPIPDLVVPDGEIRFEAKVVSGHDRALVFMLFRGASDPPRGYDLSINPSRGAAILMKEQAGSAMVPLAIRTDLARQISRDDWNEYAIRLDGPNIWVLLNGEPILSASDGMSDRGWVTFGVERLGNPDDSAETAAVFRNLRISRLAPPPPGQP